MAEYKVAAGIHIQGGAVFAKGETVESEADLYKLFPLKFEPTPEKDRPGGPNPPIHVPGDDDDDEADPEHPTRRRKRKRSSD